VVFDRKNGLGALGIKVLQQKMMRTVAKIRGDP